MLASQALNNQQQGKEEEQKKKTALQRFAEMRQANVDRLPKFGAEFDAMFRDAVKDIRATLHEAMYGKGEHGSEPGTPLNPTMQELTVNRGAVTYGNALDAPQRSRGMER